MRHRRLLLVLAGYFVASLVAPAWAQENKPDTDKDSPVFLRVQRNADGDAIALQTAIVRYVPADAKAEKVSVDLIGAVHVGDRGYYDELNKAFTEYDALLFELVAPEGTKIEKGKARERGFNPVSGLQRGMQSMLDLEFQLDQVDYTKDNFVHADMSPDEFAQSMKDKNESVLGMIFRMMGQGARLSANDKGRTNDVDMMRALFSGDSLLLKQVIASQFENLEGQMAAIEGKDGSTIITARNQKALEVLKRELKGGKKKVAIFYGAGHLSDMEARLLKDFGLKREQERWLTAWDMSQPGKSPKKAADKKAAEKKAIDKKPVEGKAAAPEVEQAAP